MNKRIIAIYGNKGVGKSTISASLSYSFGWERMSFADPIRNMLASAFGSEYLSSFADKNKPRPELGNASIRTAMMTLGTDWGRNLYNNIWVDITSKRIEYTSFTSIVIDDARFNNEYEALKKFGAKFVRLTRGSVDSSIGEQTHASEVDWQKWIPDFEIENTDKYETAKKIVEWLKTHESN